MKKFTKTMLAAAFLVGAGAANASLTVNSGAGGNELFLSVYNPNAVNADSTLGLTYNLDLNITYDQLKTNAGAAFGSGVNLAGDTNWSAFTSLITNPANVRYVLAVGNNNITQGSAGLSAGAVVTGNNPVPANPIDQTVLPNLIADRITQHASEINVGLGAGNSSIIKDVPATPFTGQFTHDVQGLPVNQTWASWPHDPQATYGSATGLWLAEAVLREYTDDFGDLVTGYTFVQSDLVKLGTVNLSGNLLSFAPTVTAVPLPAAVWLFGAGLMGMLRVTRRKSA